MSLSLTVVDGAERSVRPGSCGLLDLGRGRGQVEELTE
jgi:hypothetical protein